MNDEPMVENEQDLVKKIEQPGAKIESQAERREADLIRGAEILETPPGGNFLDALKAFSAWVSSLLGKKE